MSRTLLLICAVGAIALATAAWGAVAAPLNLGLAHPPGGDNSLQTLVKSGGMHAGSGGMYSAHTMGAPHVYGHANYNRGIALNHAGRSHHRHNRFFFVGYPYYYDDYYYGYDSCWWSRSRHRWVCDYY
ncbi:MAG: hypothetical protein JSS54_18645 [Proteobacteria bacterium]|nr:hypothetical protein [Pseudomonadota bacterium]MBS0270977.1 hypothetical protein [Pseudomonadota bacterium]